MKIFFLNLLIFSLIKFTAAQSNNIIDSLLTLLPKQQNDSVKGAFLLQIGEVYNNTDKLDSALIYFKKALYLNNKLHNTSLEINATYGIAHAYNWTGNYPEALRLSLQNLKLQEQIHDTDLIFFTKREIMWVYGNIGELKKELELVKELCSFANSGYFKDSQRITLYNQIVYHNMSNIYADMDELDSALFYRLKVYNSKGNPQMLALSAGSLAQLYRKKGNTDSSFYYSRLGMLYAINADRLDLIRGIRLNLAYLFQKKGVPDSAFYYCYKAMGDFKNVPDTSGIMEVALLLS
jgi:two-component system, NtrC family, sensor kinase